MKTERVANYLPGTQIEIINPVLPHRQLQHAVFDFDGTISLIREGWQQIMASMMVEILLTTPTAEDKASLGRLMTDYVAQSTGQPTINQMVRLAEEVGQRGGRPQSPQEYKRIYIDRLEVRIENRLAGLSKGQLDLAELVVPGIREILATLSRQNVICYLASGTDERHVINEARILGVADFFDGRMYGARDDGNTISKKMLIDRILSEYDLVGYELVIFGDGHDEIYHAAQANAIAVGVASNEAERQGINLSKRRQLIQAGADIIIPDFREYNILLGYLNGTE